MNFGVTMGTVLDKPSLEPCHLQAVQGTSAGGWPG